MRIWPLLLALPAAVLSMRVDPERIAARLRIEGEDIKSRIGRGRRQSPLTKEISIQVTAPLFSSRLFEYGKDVGDTEVPQSLDVGKKVDLTQPISFYGSDYNTVYVLSNGGIGFEPNSRSYKPGLLPSTSKMIAPFWNRNDLRNGGHVYYRVVKKGRVLERGASEINYQYGGNRVKVHMALVVTWDKMQPLGSDALPEDNTNTFQAAIFITDNGTFANFIYNNIGWTQGAEAGFNQGDGTSHFALPTSGTGNIMYLEENGNTGIPGEWIFELGASRVVRCKAGWKGETCDQQCAAGEWGTDCAGCCHCANGGTCNNVTGECAAGCSECWTGASCQTKKENCKGGKTTTQCAANAISFSENDRCGEPVQRCQCLAGFKGDGLKGCHDIDECRQPGICHPQATCTNTPGHYFCQCKAGLQGDGVKECSTSFLYSSEGHQALPKSKNSKVTWQLRNPLKVMGQVRDKLTITTSGLIALNDVIDVSATRLDDTHMTGVAPFFAPIDISASGQVTVAEITENDVLSRAKREIEQQYGTVFQPKSMVVVTYSNVSDGNSQKGNTFQTAFIGGIDGNKEQTTFVQLLYKDMPWADKAEAGIMTNEVSSSVALPGSGTEGLSQLPQLSNVGHPGLWMYRIDESTVQPCPQDDRQPPYCDQPSSQKDRQNLNKKSEDLRLGVAVEGPRTIIPTLDNGQTPRRPTEERRPTFTSASPRPATTSRPRPRFESTPHRPLVSLGLDDFEVDPDVFEAVSFPSVITVQPEIMQKGRKLPDFTQSSSSSTTTSTTTTTTTTTKATTTTAKPTTEPTFPTFAVEQVETVAPKKQNFADLAVPEKTTTKEAPSTTEELILGEAEDAVEEQETTTPQKPIFVFTQPPKVTTRPTPPPSPPKRPANIVTARTTTEASLDDANPGLAVMVPAIIVLIWMALIAVIVVVVCCRRRNTAHMNSIYGPTYGVRPTGYAPKRGSKHLEGSYEDHLEKAARLSTEMGAYGQPTRLSLYGSYWNLNNSSSSPGSGPSTRHSPPFNNHTRYTYTGRY